MENINDMGKAAKAASRQLGQLSSSMKNKVLLMLADKLIEKTSEIISANSIDIEKAKEANMRANMLDRLKLDEKRIKGMAEGLVQLSDLEDPIGNVLSMKKRPNGLLIGQRVVPIGVVLMIYEARPNVTIDAFGLCFKTGNAVILKGGSDALSTNGILVKIIKDVLKANALNENSVSFIDSPDRSILGDLLKMTEYIDVVIPRGGAGLIKYVVNNSVVPVIETGTGNCHVYVDEFADFDMAIKIIINAKTQRNSVCNACESLVVHEKIADAFIPQLANALFDKNVEIRGDEKSRFIVPKINPATNEDFATEYLDAIISLKVVGSIDEAIEHINTNNTGHSETIVTKDYNNANKFLDMIDAACVYVNASTRFSDGFEFGLGAEIGISTQKLHARGPMGLMALTSTKYTIYGDGQIRE